MKACKAKAGVEFIQSQEVFNVERFRDYMTKVRDMGLLERVCFLAGVIPVKSVGAYLSPCFLVQLFPF